MPQFANSMYSWAAELCAVMFTTNDLCLQQMLYVPVAVYIRWTQPMKNGSNSCRSCRVTWQPSLRNIDRLRRLSNDWAAGCCWRPRSVLPSLYLFLSLTVSVSVPLSSLMIIHRCLQCRHWWNWAAASFHRSRIFTRSPFCRKENTPCSLFLPTPNVSLSFTLAA